MGLPPWVLDYHASFVFSVPPERLWEEIEDVDSFEQWWAWLSELRIEGGGLKKGAVWHGVVSPPLPYRMRITVEIEECERAKRIAAAVHGDLEGHTTLVFEGHGDGSLVEVAWTIEMMQLPMRLAARVARPLLNWGHDRVVEATVQAFERHLASHR
jgi:uncharacterized protein YndB with AHSA1/START domain